MSISSITRDQGINVSIVRIVTSDTLAAVAATDYILDQEENITEANNGAWTWLETDMLLVAASDGNAFFEFTDDTFSSLIIYGSVGGGVVNSGLVNQLAWYSATGSTVSGLATANNGVLVTNGSGVPSISTTLPAGLTITGYATIVNVQNQGYTYAVATGLANNYNIALTPAPSAYTDGMLVAFRSATDNSGASAANVNGLGATAIVTNDNVALSGGEILNGGSYLLVYNSSFAKFVLVNSSAGGGSSPWTVGAGATSAQGGSSATATGDDSVAYGAASTIASGLRSVAMGSGVTASGDHSVALGINTTASGRGAFCATEGGQALGQRAVCLANNGRARGDNSFVVGNGAVTGVGSTNNIAMGNGCTANGDYSTAAGINASTTNNYSYVLSGEFVSASDSATNQYVATFSGGFRYYIDSTTMVVNIDAAGNLINLRGEADQSKTVLTPLTGDTITLVTTRLRTLLNPAGTLATLTLTMPASPIDGQVLIVTTTQVITALTVNPGAGQTVIVAPTALAAGQSFALIYDLATTSWYPA